MRVDAMNPLEVEPGAGTTLYLDCEITTDHGR